MDPRPPDRTLSTYCQNPAPLLKSEQYIVYKLSAAVVRWGLEGLLRRRLSVDVATGQQPLHARYPLANHRTDNKSNKRKECEKVRRARQSLWRPSDEHESNLEPMYTHHPPSTRWERGDIAVGGSTQGNYQGALLKPARNQQNHRTYR